MGLGVGRGFGGRITVRPCWQSLGFRYGGISGTPLYLYMGRVGSKNERKRGRKEKEEEEKGEEKDRNNKHVS